MKASHTYHIWTIGCQMNEADARRLAAQLESLGYSPAHDPRRARLLILNTCVVRQQAEDKIYRRLSYFLELKQAHPDCILAVMGCLTGKSAAAREKLRHDFPLVDVWMRPSETAPLLEHLQQRAQRPAPLSDGGGCHLPPSAQGQTITAHIPIVLGCSHACTYCVIPYRRGGEKSRPAPEILQEANQLVAAGVREITLLGQIVDRYGHDRPGEPDLAALLVRVAQIPDLLRVRFLTNHPQWMTDKLMQTVATTPKLCPYFELPVQAGNNGILAAMRRGYTTDDYRALICRIRALLPEAGISTDIIVGFPGETTQQFEDTLKLMDEINPDMIRIAKYSPRPQTYAARHLPDDVPEAEKERRRAAVDAQLRHHLGEKHRDWTGRILEVLVEAHEKNGRWRGRTANNKLVFMEGGADLLGRMAHVRITWAGPFTLIGEWVPE